MIRSFELVEELNGNASNPAAAVLMVAHLLFSSFLAARVSSVWVALHLPFSSFLKCAMYLSAGVHRC